MVGPSLRVPQKHLGRGSYGHVFLAEDLPRNGSGSKRDVAVKLLPKETNTHQSDVICHRSSLRREAEILGALQGKPNIVELRGLYEDDQFAYIAMEPCDSGDLQGLLDRNSGAMRERLVAGLARQMCQAMLGVHTENVCYSDVKVSSQLSCMPAMCLSYLPPTSESLSHSLPAASFLSACQLPPAVQ